MIRPLLLTVTAALLCPGCVVTTHVIPRSADARINAYGERFRARIEVVTRGEETAHAGDSVHVDGGIVRWADADSARWISKPWTSIRRIRYYDRLSGTLEGAAVGGGVCTLVGFRTWDERTFTFESWVVWWSAGGLLLGGLIGVTEAHKIDFVLGFSDVRTDVLAAVADDGRALEYASDSLRNDREVVLTAVRKHPDAIRFASKRLQEDHEIQSAVIHNP